MSVRGDAGKGMSKGGWAMIYEGEEATGQATRRGGEGFDLSLHGQFVYLGFDAALIALNVSLSLD